MKKRHSQRPLIRTTLPGPVSAMWQEREAGSLAPGSYGPIEDRRFYAHASHNAIIEDVDGNMLIDFGSAWGTNNLGGGHPEVLHAAISTLGEIGVTCWTAAGNSPHRVELAEKLLAVCPESIDRAVFLTTGTEAVEAALRMMRRASGRPFVLSFYGQFHGMSYGALGAGPVLASFRDDVAPLVNGFAYVPYPNPYRGLVHPHGGTVGEATLRYIEETILEYEVPADQIAGVLFEPVAGEGGVWVPPDDFLPGLREMCDRYGWYLCLDEVQSGFGRCGKMWAFEHWDAEPDVLVIGKGLSGGVMPIAAVATRAEIAEPADAFVAGTYAGQPAACAAAMKTIEVLAQDRIHERAADLGAYALGRLSTLSDRFDIVGDVRGLGLWLGIELVTDSESRVRNYDAAKLVHRQCIEQGLYYIHEDTSSTVRIQPPLTIERGLFEQGLDILEKAISSAAG